MDSNEVFYRGILSNTDESVLDLKLKNGFKIRAISDREAFHFILNTRSVNNGEALRILGRLCGYSYCSQSTTFNPVYVVENSIHYDGQSNSASIYNSINRFLEEMVHGYLLPKLQLIRLFKEGYLCIPAEFFYVVENGKTKGYVFSERNRHSDELFKIEHSESKELHDFLEKTKLPFKEQFLQRAFSNYEVSYRLHDPASSFLNLMMSLECLFNPAYNEVRYRVSRNVAVLLGTTFEESENIFSEIKELYSKRSEVIHTGNTKKLTLDDILKLRNYVRESIKKMYNMEGPKEEILNLLNSRGFGEKYKTVPQGS